MALRPLRDATAGGGGDTAATVAQGPFYGLAALARLGETVLHCQEASIALHISETRLVFS